MSRSSDAGHFFQTDASIQGAARREAKRHNELGRPVRLQAKLLAVTPDPGNASCVFIAEAAGVVLRVDVDTGDFTPTFKTRATAQAPFTSLAVGSEVLYAGSWDKNVYAWDLATAASKVTTSSRVFTAGHSDFVKALLAFETGGKKLLLSASADATLVVWDASTSSKLHTLKGHTRGVQALTLEHLTKDHAIVVSGDSSREIRRWHISPSQSFELPTSGSDSLTEPIPSAGPIQPLLAHETSIYALTFDEDGDLWTASADKTAKCLSRAQNWKEDTVLQHPDFVRAIGVHEGLGLIVTACRDENVRVWDKATGKLVHVYEGHFEEVTGLVVDESGRRVVSVSIDGTLRVWGLTRADFEKYQTELERMRKNGDPEGVQGEKSLLTAEEEAELADLLDEVG